jgi:putative ABC transport system ATP-binding protein
MILASDTARRGSRSDESPGSTDEPPIIALSNIVKSYKMGGEDVMATRGISLIVARGEFVAIMGASGSGKSTLMNIMGCLDVPTSGHYHLDGVNIRSLDDRALSRIRNRKIGFVFQGFNLIPRMSALQNVELPMAYAGIKPAERRQRAIVALSLVGLGGRLEHVSSELSGGQQQRVAIARAISTNPALILADEPTGNLDTKSSVELMTIFSNLHAHGRTIVMITHEHDVAEYASRVVEVRDGMIKSDHVQRALTPTPSRLGHSGTTMIDADEFEG